MDGLLVGTGIFLFAYSIIMFCLYVFGEKGSILDPLAISWFGFLLNIPVGIFAVGLRDYERPGFAFKGTAILIIIVGTLFYTLGLYSGRGAGLNIDRQVLPGTAAPKTVVKLTQESAQCRFDFHNCFCVHGDNLPKKSLTYFSQRSYRPAA